MSWPVFSGWRARFAAQSSRFDPPAPASRRCELGRCALSAFARSFRWSFCCILLVCLSTAVADNRQGPADSKDGSEEGQALVSELLSQTPDENAAFRGLLILRDARAKRSRVEVKYSILVSKEGWSGIYETVALPGQPSERLVIHHRENQPNQYLYRPASAPETAADKPLVLTGAQAAIPFAGSDFWLSDLGLEFLHWPRQRIVKDAKIKMRSSRPCKVLESVNPDPGATNYARVVSWIDAEHGAPIYAEAQDRMGQALKVFSLSGFQRVSGRFEPKAMEMRNEKSDSRTRLEFKHESE